MQLPPAAFIFSIVGVGVSLAGFSGLVLAFARGGPLKPVDAFRLRLLPEMALAVSFLALLTTPLADATGNVKAAIQIACGLGLFFTLSHRLRLLARARAENISQPAIFNAFAVLIDLLNLLVAAVGVVQGTAVLFEWLLVFMLARPGLTFVFVLSEVSSS